ncbi:MAG: hypothetical protein ACTHK7_10385, partial [Aureliella sp.]
MITKIIASPFLRALRVLRGKNSFPFASTIGASMLISNRIPCILIATICLNISLSTKASDQIPGARPQQPIAIVGATVHTICDETLTDATIVIKEGKIARLATDVKVPDDAQRIDAKGAHVYPGLIDPLSNIGLTEIDSVRATLDMRETGAINPNVRAEAAFNPDSELIPVARANGVLLGVSAPDGGLVGGRSALMMLDGWTWEDMTLQEDIGMQITWPRVEPANGDAQGQSDESELEKLEELFDQAARYRAAAQSDKKPTFDARLDALVPVLERKMPLIATAYLAPQIRSAVAFARQHNVRLIIYGGYDALDCQEILLAEKVPVIVGGVYRLPTRRDQPYDDPYTLPSRLHKAGIAFCIATAGRFGGSTLR